MCSLPQMFAFFLLHKNANCVGINVLTVHYHKIALWFFSVFAFRRLFSPPPIDHKAAGKICVIALDNLFFKCIWFSLELHSIWLMNELWICGVVVDWFNWHVRWVCERSMNQKFHDGFMNEWTPSSESSTCDSPSTSMTFSEGISFHEKAMTSKIRYDSQSLSN